VSCPQLGDWLHAGRRHGLDSIIDHSAPRSQRLMTAPKILFDTNAFYACEDVRVGRQHANSVIATDLKDLAQRQGCELFLHPATERDINRAGSVELRRATLLKYHQWRRLARIRHRQDLLHRAGYTEPLSSNDSVDLEMLAALDNNAVDLLVTEDRPLRDHAEKAGLGGQTLSILGTIEYLKRLFGQPVELPTVHRRAAYEISLDDPLFNSLREGYPDFEDWWMKVCRQHRDCRTVEGPTGQLEALAVLKQEHDRPFGLAGQIVKLCTFKVASEAEGAKRGELVLKAVFQYANEHDADFIYVTVFEHHVGLVALFESFGFTAIDQHSELGELVMVKQCRPPAHVSDCTPLDYNRLYGPGAAIVGRAFVIPIQPHWHDVLFPEARFQGRLLGEEPSGNAMLKAYLCRSSIRRLSPGDLVLFYRSRDQKAATVIGVVEETLPSDDPDKVRRFVSTRTVYTDRDIAAMCDEGEVLAILFRQDRALDFTWPLALLKEHRVLSAAPQSIQQISNEEGLEWLRDQLNAPH
jgi:predicted RNA-binding protein with PUA-like domain/L-amino acid N-acyltransferase YncA